MYRLVLSLKHAVNAVRSELRVRLLRMRGARVGEGVRIGKRVHVDLGRGARLIIGDGVKIDTGCFITVGAGSSLSIGRETYIFHNTDISSLGDTEIGSFCSIAPYVTIIDSDHCYDDPGRPVRFQGGTVRKIVVGDEVWIGTRSVILSGVTLGKHAVIAAGSVVTKDVPGYTLAGGVPASVLKRFGTEPEGAGEEHGE